MHDVYELVKANQADFPVRTLCRVLRVSASGYSDWTDRAPSAQAVANSDRMQHICEVHRASDATYGAPRIAARHRRAGLGTVDPWSSACRLQLSLRVVAHSTGRWTPDELLGDWNFYLAYNLFRLAAITQGIAKRVVDGAAASAQAKATGAATRGLAELAWSFAQKA